MSEIRPVYIPCASGTHAQTDCCIRAHGDLIRLQGHPQMDFTAQQGGELIRAVQALLPHDDAIPPPRARQEGGTHYLAMTVQPWDAMRSWLSPEQFTGFLAGNAIKYLARFNAKSAGKGGLPDLEKARHYIDELLAWESRP